jgi:cytochrome c peroxidase
MGMAPLVLLPIAYGLLYWAGAPDQPKVKDGQARPASSIRLAGSPIAPLPESLPTDPGLVALGRALFNDPILSANGEVSCATCHDVAAGGTDGRARSIGVSGTPGRLNAPTVLNAAFNFAQFWDGRARSLEEQIGFPVHHPDELASSWPAVIAALGGEAPYRRLFDALFADGITAANIQKAIAEYERTLITPGAPFDRYLQGEDGAIDAKAKRGYRLFRTLGCSACHQGRNVGGNLLQKLGIVHPYYSSTTAGNPADLGRFNVTGDPADRHVFKVPSLRNVALTAPYFHDGSIENLDEAIATMAFFQLGRRLELQEIEAIEAFLWSLTGELRS